MRGMVAGMAWVAAALATPVQAAWFEASSDHFIIDADSSEARVRDFATRLERFDSALRRLYSVGDDPSGRSNRIQLFAANIDTIVKLCGSDCPSGVRGFYNPHAGGSVIFTATLTTGQSPLDLNAQAVLLHEYSHHFMFSNFPVAYPIWFTEGFAEFNANVMFEDDGSIVIGAPANYRAAALFSDNRLPMSHLLDPTEHDLKDPATLDLIYGRGWLLVHYLMMDPARRKQLNAYLDMLNAGQPNLKAAQSAFGDLARLNKDLQRYLNTNRFHEMEVRPSNRMATVEVKPLSEGAAAMMTIHMRSTKGVSPQRAKALAPEAEKRAVPYPNDPRVQVELAEAEFDAGNDDAADAAADRALAADSGNRTAMLYKGRVAVRRATAAHALDPKRWAEARSWYVRANRADPDAVVPLLLYYLSYLAQGVPAPNLAVQGLEKAALLAPEDSRVLWLLATRKLADGDPATARALLTPVAYAPHATRGADAARAVIDLIDTGNIADAKTRISNDKSLEDDGDAYIADQPKSRP